MSYKSQEIYKGYIIRSEENDVYIVYRADGSRATNLEFKNAYSSLAAELDAKAWIDNYIESQKK
jgi:hypothetical protein